MTGKKHHQVSAKSLRNLIPAKKGEIRNPRGAGAHNPIPKALRKLTVQEVIEVGTYVLEQNYVGLQELIKEAKAEDSSCSMLKLWIANVALQAYKKGDHVPLDALLNRLIGKVKDNIDIRTTSTSPQVVVLLPPKEEEILPAIIDVTPEKKEDGSN